jgi:methylthioribose-1-phosphate isomerase
MDDFDYARYDRIRPIRWTGDALELLDQRKLPFDTEYLTCRTSDDVAAAIHALAVRGAPAIGIAAAWGVVLAEREIEAADARDAAAKLEPALQRLNAARPTAVNLAWALARMRAALARADHDWRGALEREAQAIDTEDLAANRQMGALGASLIEPGSGVLTHCNTGSLATAGFGTALGVIRAGCRAGPHRTGVRRRNAPVVAGRAPDRVGTAAGRDRRHADRRFGRLAPDEDRQGAMGGRRRRPHLRQRRHRQQDRHLPARHRRAPPRRRVHGGGAVLDRRHGHAQRRPDRNRGARCRELHVVGGSRTVAEGIDAWNPVFDVTPTI